MVWKCFWFSFSSSSVSYTQQLSVHRIRPQISKTSCINKTKEQKEKRRWKSLPSTPQMVYCLFCGRHEVFHPLCERSSEQILLLQAVCDRSRSKCKLEIEERPRGEQAPFSWSLRWWQLLCQNRKPPRYPIKPSFEIVSPSSHTSHM